MKKLSIIFGGIFILILSSFNATAQDWEEVNPKMIHILADNTFLKAYEVTLEPGEKSGMHTHSASFIYNLTDGKLKVHYKDGKEELSDLKPGDTGAYDPDPPHVTENVGSTTVKYLMVELKEHPYKAPKKK